MGAMASQITYRRWKKTSKLRITGLCVGNSPGTSEFPAQRASNAENVSIWWRHHESQSTIFMRTPQDLPKWGCIMPTSGDILGVGCHKMRFSYLIRLPHRKRNYKYWFQMKWGLICRYFLFEYSFLLHITNEAWWKKYLEITYFYCGSL